MQSFALWDPLSDKMLKENDFSKANLPSIQKLFYKPSFSTFFTVQNLLNKPYSIIIALS